MKNAFFQNSVSAVVESFVFRKNGNLVIVKEITQLSRTLL